MKESKQVARLLDIMRDQGGKDNPETLLIGVMKSAKTCSIGDLVLDAEDLLVNSYYTGNNKLHKGDQVVLMKVQDQDIYVILSKVVSL